MIKNYYIYILITFLFFSCKKESTEFEVFGEITGDLPDYLHIEYDSILDSSKIKNNTFYFKGKVDQIVRAQLFINPISTIDSSIFIENTKINLKLHIDKKEYKQNIINFIGVKSISGTITQKIIEDFNNFYLANVRSADWNDKLFDEIDRIAKTHPKNPFSVELLHRFSANKSLSINQTKSIFQQLNDENSEKFYLNELRKMIFPSEKIIVGNYFKHFTLPNRNEKLISTSSFNDPYLFIDFWASWCAPCINQFPSLKELHKKFSKSQLRIIGVSLDTKKDKWIEVLNTHNLPWENLIEIKGFNSLLSNEFGITYLPHNLLIDSSGKIIAIDIKINDIESEFNKHLDK